MQMSPLDARFPLFLGILFDSYGDYPDATQALAKAHELSPRKQGILFQQAADAEARGDVQSELKFLKMAHDLAPAYKDARMYYAAALIKSGDAAQAEQLIAPLVQSGDAADARLAAAYAAKGQYQKIAALWTAHVAAYPNDLQGYFTLAAAYYAAGNSAQAIATLQAAEKQDASISGQAEQFIAQIKAGKK
jgi:tetratricopeptide (TPR) repeat protein